MAVAAPPLLSGRLAPIAGLWTWLCTTLRVMRGNKAGFLGFLVVVAMTGLSILAPYVLPFDPKADATAIYQGPSGEHWLGTDSQGRDVFREVVNGGRDILAVGYLAAAVTTFLGVAIGAFSAYAGGNVDAILTWVADVFLTVPQFALLAVLAAFIKLEGNIGVALLIAAFGWPGLMRAIRAQVLSLKQRDYIEAARLLDLTTPHIILREIAPGMAGYIAVHFVLNVTAAMYASVGLIFLGIVPISGLNWGVMLNLAWTQGAIFFRDSVWYIMAPIAAIVLFQLAMLNMARSLSEVFDPRLRRGGER